MGSKKKCDPPIEISVKGKKMNLNHDKVFAQIADHVMRAADVARKNGLTLTADELHNIAVQITEPVRFGFNFKPIPSWDEE